MNETNLAGDAGGNTSSTVGVPVPPPAPTPVGPGPGPNLTAAELVAGEAVARIASAELPAAPPAAASNELPPEPVRLPRKGAGARLRKKLLGATAREHWCEVIDPDTNELEECLLLSPTVAQADRIVSKAMILPDKEMGEGTKVSLNEVTIDQAELKVQALIACLKDPETRQPLLTVADRNSLLEGPMNYLYAALADEARDMLNPSISKAKKNSKGIRRG